MSVSNLGGFEPQLLIMAGGLGSRFGGVKQIAAVGPNGESIIDYSIRDAKRAGFGGVVLIVRSDIEDDVKAHIARHHKNVSVSYVCQDHWGPPRDKPWGTLHAVLAARSAITQPFAVINADDYYGLASFETAMDSLKGIGPGQAANVVFELSKTVPPSGAVSRGLVQVVEGHLAGIVETHDCQRNDDGTYTAGAREVVATTPVSMNFWCFHPTVFDDFAQMWDAFIAENADELKAEAMLPSVVDELMRQDRMVVKVLSSPERWVGITHPDDQELVRSVLFKTRRAS